MTKSELISQLHITQKHNHLGCDDVQYGVDLILECLSDAFTSGGRVEVRGFGSFKLNHRNARIGRNPKTGEVVHVPDKYAVNFRPALDLRQRVDMHS